MLKHKLAEARRTILTMPQSQATNWREAEIRRATGETQKLRVLHMEPNPEAAALTAARQRTQDYQEFVANRPPTRRPASNGTRS